MNFLKKSTWIQGKIINEAFPRDEGDFLHHGGAAAEAELLQLQQGVDEAATAVQGLSREKRKKKKSQFKRFLLFKTFLFCRFGFGFLLTLPSNLTNRGHSFSTKVSFLAENNF